MADDKPLAALIVHSGELRDVCDLLADSGIAFEQMPPGSGAVGAALGTPLVISSAPFLLDCLKRGLSFEGQRMVILDGESRTARSMLARGGVEWMVRRPVHPAALRLLALHCLYNGPEKRRSHRVTIGAKVGFRVGWRALSGILEELSVRDCRILSPRPVDIAARVKLRLPSEIAGGKPLKVSGRVVRLANAADADGATEICLVFDAQTPDVTVRLSEIVSAHEHGPAVLQGEKVSAATKRDRPTRSVISVDAATPSSAPAPSRDETGPEAADEGAASDRRGDDRHAFDRRVIAISDQATRVLVGRDISAGGMRVSPTPRLSLGDEVQIAVHVPGHETPLILTARVARDDGESGLMLAFGELSKTADTYLEEMLAELPSLASSDEASSTGEELRLVTEIVRRR